MRQLKCGLLAMMGMLMYTLTAQAADSIYVCRNGVYENRLLEEGLEVKKEDFDCDSIVFSRPKPHVLVNFSDFARQHRVEAVFVKAQGGQKVASYNSMKSYTVSSSAISDVVRAEVPEGDTQVNVMLNAVTNLTTGVAITLMYDDGQFLTMYDETPIMMRQNDFVHRYVFQTEGAKVNNWMATLPSRMLFHMITMPGAHDAATSAVGMDMAQTQSLTVAELLTAGVRAFDFRPRYTSSKESDIQLENLEIYHGILGTGVKWKDAMDVLVQFLKDNPTETVFVNLQKEKAYGTDYSSTWRTSIRTWLQNNRDYVLQKITTSTSLSDCRGKIVVVSHNPYGPENSYYGTVYGGLTASWGDNETFTTTINYTNSSVICSATISDNYDVTKAADKQGYIKANLDAANADKTTRWFYTFMNVAGSLFGGSPSDYAEPHNAYVNDLLQSGTYTSRLGIIFYDYCGDSNYTPNLLSTLIQHNYQYIY
jgi:1-phosphatidylinositol phosphodiesterase